MTSTRDMGHLARDMGHLTRDMEHLTRDMGHLTRICMCKSSLKLSLLKKN